MMSSKFDWFDLRFCLKLNYIKTNIVAKILRGTNEILDDIIIQSITQNTKLQFDRF